MHKSERLDAIIALVGKEQIGRQDQLVDLLNKQGLGVTQSSVSRDLEELGIAKAGRYYVLQKKSISSDYGDVDIKRAGDNLIVIQCESGFASAIAVKIDSSQLGEIIGTIAGDDTIFVAVENPAAQMSVLRRLSVVLFDQKPAKQI